MNLRPYAEYRDSELPWVGKIPAHWQVLRNGGLFAHRVETGYPDLPILEVSLRTGVTIRDFGNTKRKQVMSQREKYKRARQGDIAYNMMRMWQGAVGVSPVDGLVSPAYVVVRPYAGTDTSYFNCLFGTQAYKAEVNKYSRGIVADRNRLYWDDFKQMSSIVPSLDEQSKIAAFLRSQDRQIAKLIRGKRRLIELLNEQKQTIIHRAVTRGLNPDVPLKPSGVDWLGDVPVHWEIRRLRHLIKGRLTYGANAAAEFDNPDWPRYIRITDFRSDGLLKLDTFRSLPPDSASDYLVEPGDILFARSGATVGKAFLVSDETGVACHAGYLIRARPDSLLVTPLFLFAFTQSRAFVAWKNSTFNITTIQNIGADKYANLYVPLPPLKEQLVILGFIGAEQQPLNTAIRRTEREIVLIREYRDRLISDVVTGQIDVRGWQPEPDDESDTESLTVLSEADENAESLDDEEVSDV